MSNKLIETDEQKKQGFKSEIIRLTLETVDNKFKNRSGKDTEENVLSIERIRNNEIERDSDGNPIEIFDKNKNKLSGKMHAQLDGVSSKCLYDVLYRLKIIEKVSFGVLGMVEEGWLNVHSDYLSTMKDTEADEFVPILGIISGSLYITETHKFYSTFIELLNTDIEYANCAKKYNESVMGRKSLISRQEKKFLYNALSIPFTKYEINKIKELVKKKDKKVKMFGVSNTIIGHITENRIDKYDTETVRKIREVL